VSHTLTEFQQEIKRSNDESSDCSSTCVYNSGNSSSERRLARLTVKLRQSKHYQGQDAAVAASTTEPETVAAGSTGAANSSNSSGGHSSGSADCSRNTANSNSELNSVTKQLLALQAARVAAAQQRAETARLTAAAASRSFKEADARLAELDEHVTDVCAFEIALKGAAAAAVKASDVYNARVVAFEKLQLELRFQREQRQCVGSNTEHDCASTHTISAAVTAMFGESDSDDDCPPLAHAGSLQLSGDSQTATRPALAVAAPSCNSGSSSSNTSSSSSDTISSTDSNSNAHEQQQAKQLVQQPCVNCGKLTKKRCRRCQAVYYCSEECQIECFKDPQHRAQCEVTAAVAVTTTIVIS
jgi:MYND finger